MLSSRALQQRWYSEQQPPWALRLAERLYRAGVERRRRRYRDNASARIRLACPVLVVGNISVGGAGKTPLVIALAEHLHAQGFRPGVVSRGYGGRERGPALLPETADPSRFGDEPAMIRRRTGIPLAVGVDRPAAAELLIAAGCDVVIADDGLQHYRLARDIEICVLDGQRRLGNGHLLPAGPLREPPARLREVDYVVCNGGDPHPGEVPMRLLGDTLVALDDPALSRALGDLAGRRVHAVAGIGHPARFFATLRAAGLELIEHAFADHHAFTARDLVFAEPAPIVMTEKDAIKCVRLACTDTWVLPVHAALPPAFLDTLTARLHAATATN